MKIEKLAILFLFVVLSACGNDSQEDGITLPEPKTQQDTIPTLQGEFIYLDSAAVLKGANFIYGVHMDSIAFELAKKLEPLKNDDFDMLPVTLKAKIIPNPKRKGWDELIEIQKVLKTPEIPDTTKTISEKE